jgi:hypothetical protein
LGVRCDAFDRVACPRKQHIDGWRDVRRADGVEARQAAKVEERIEIELVNELVNGWSMSGSRFLGH